MPNLVYRLFHSDVPVALDAEAVTVHRTDFRRHHGAGEGLDAVRCDGGKTLFNDPDDVIAHAEFHGARGCRCIPHANCGHRVRWTGVIDDGELILGTGSWVHIDDDRGNHLLPREA